MNARQRRKARRMGLPNGFLVTMEGFIRMVGDQDPDIYRKTGQLYENTKDGKLRVTIDGQWVVAVDEFDAKRKVQNYLLARSK